MNFTMWGKALQGIPRLDKNEWNGLDIISRWLVATRAAVLIMTFLSAAIAGILAYKAGHFNAVQWGVMALGLIMAHATNNLLNDYTDYRRGVDRNNYFRTQYGPQPLEQGLMTKRELLLYAAVTGAVALACGVYLVAQRGPLALLLLGAGAFFVLFYTWPLKYIGLGEIAVLIVWGPLMIGGGYYVITGAWDWNVVIASLPYALGVTTVIFGKHIDKYPRRPGERHPHPAGRDRGKGRPVYRPGDDRAAVPVGGLPGGNRFLLAGPAGGGFRADPDPGRFGRCSAAQNRKPARRNTRPRPGRCGSWQ